MNVNAKFASHATRLAIVLVAALAPLASSQAADSLQYLGYLLGEGNVTDSAAGMQRGAAGPLKSEISPADTFRQLGYLVGEGNESATSETAGVPGDAAGSIKSAETRRGWSQAHAGDGFQRLGYLVGEGNVERRVAIQ